METNDKFTKITQIVVAVLLLVSIGLNVYLLTKENECKVIEKVKTEIVRDTLRDTVLQVKHEKIIAYRHDTLTIVDSIPGDTVQCVVEVPVSQKKYSDDSTYTAWVSGYRPNLDSINIYRNTVYVTREITKTKRQRLIIGPHVGYSYDFQHKTFGPTVGIGITYNLFGF